MFDIIPCKCCGTKDSPDYVPIYKPYNGTGEPVTDYWLCDSCYNTTNNGMNKE
jgi:hypothetical protein